MPVGLSNEPSIGPLALISREMNSSSEEGTKIRKSTV
jgi:hypothetical protein